MSNGLSRSIRGPAERRIISERLYFRQGNMGEKGYWIYSCTLFCGLDLFVLLYDALKSRIGVLRCSG